MIPTDACLSFFSSVHVVVNKLPCAWSELKRKQMSYNNSRYFLRTEDQKVLDLLKKNCRDFVRRFHLVYVLQQQLNMFLYQKLRMSQNKSRDFQRTRADIYVKKYIQQRLSSGQSMIRNTLWSKAVIEQELKTISGQAVVKQIF